MNYTYKFVKQFVKQYKLSSKSKLESLRIMSFIDILNLIAVQEPEREWVNVTWCDDPEHIQIHMTFGELYESEKMNDTRDFLKKLLNLFSLRSNYFVMEIVDRKERRFSIGCIESK